MINHLSAFLRDIQGEGASNRRRIFTTLILRSFVAHAALMAALLYGHRPALAWSAGGHMVVASLAYQNLPPTTKRQVDALLQAHPAAPQWNREAQAELAGKGEPGAFNFLHASVWPDEIRRHGSHFDHPRWHYIDYALTPPYHSLPLGAQEPDPQDDILFGIMTSERTIADAHITSLDRAVALSWLIHLVGDIHQPLHCSTLVDGKRFVAPQGDRGGNSVYVRYGDRAQKLHAFWDEQMTNSKDVTWAARQATVFQRAWPRQSLGELRQAVTPKAWSLESFRQAISATYRNGTIPLGTDYEHAGLLSQNYLQDAKMTSARRITLAGYRLASEIARLLP